LWEGLFGERKDEARILPAWCAEREDTSPVLAIDGELCGGRLGASILF
jgi:hypothetical protein